MKKICCHKAFLCAFTLMMAGGVWGKLSLLTGDEVTSQRSEQTTAFEVHTDRKLGTMASPHILYYPFINTCSGSLENDARTFTRVIMPQDNVACREDSVLLQGAMTIPLISSASGYAYAALETGSAGQFKVVAIRESEEDDDDADHFFIAQGGRKMAYLDLGQACQNTSCVLPSGDNAILTRLLVLFTSPQQSLGPGDTLDSSDGQLSEALVLKVKLARKLPSLNTQTRLLRCEVFAGDTQAFIDYNAKGLSLIQDEVAAVHTVVYPGPEQAANYCDTQLNSACNQICGATQSCTTERLKEARGHLSKGVTVTGLENGQEIHVSACVENKWGFCSLFPASLAVTPKELEAFLKEQSCFFFSAGFGREHPVIEDLKWFRDHVLAQYSWGQRGIAWYYSVGPKYAGWVAQKPALRAVVRGLGHFFSWIIDSFRGEKLLKHYSSPPQNAKLRAIGMVEADSLFAFLQRCSQFKLWVVGQ